MVAGAIAGNISAEATTPTGNTFAEAMQGIQELNRYEDGLSVLGCHALLASLFQEGNVLKDEGARTRIKERIDAI